MLSVCVLEDLLHPFGHCSLPLNPLFCGFGAASVDKTSKIDVKYTAKNFFFFSAAGTVDLRKVVIV